MGKVDTSPRRLGDPHRIRAWGKIRSGPLLGKVATSPLPSRGSPPHQSGGDNEKWPTSGQSGHVTPAVSGIPTASERGAKSEVAHFWAKWLRHRCRLGDPHRYRAGGKITSGPIVGKVATSPLPSRGSPPHQSGRKNQKWPNYGQNGYVTLAVSGIPSAAERGAKSQVAHLWATGLRHPCGVGDPHGIRAGGGGESEVAQLWAKWVCHPCCLWDPHRCTAGGKIKVAPLWAKWLRHPCHLGDPQGCTAVGKIRSGPLPGKVATSPCRLGDPHRMRAGGKIRKSRIVGKVATSPLPSRGSPAPQSGEQNQKWPTCGQRGYVTPAVLGIPTASKRGEKSEVAHLWARWLRHPCRLGDSHRCTAGGKMRSGPLVGKVATSPLPSQRSPPHQSGGDNQKWPTCGQGGYVTLPSRGSPPLKSGGQNQKWPTSGQSGYVTPAVSGIPTASERGENQKWPISGQSGYVTVAVLGIPSAAERGAKSQVANLWAKWLRHHCRLGIPTPSGDPHRIRAAGKIRNGPIVGKVATSPLPARGSPALQSGGRNHKWPNCGQSEYVTLAVCGIPTASKRGAK